MSMNIDELNAFAESLDEKIQEISGYLETCITKTDLNNNTSKIFVKLSKDVNTKIEQIYSEVSSKYAGTDFTSSVLEKVMEDVYTKEEIDNKHYLTKHQSLDNYLTKDYLLNNYVKKYDLHLYIDSTYLKRAELTSYLENYAKLSDVSEKLEDYYTKKEVDDKLDEISLLVPSIDNLATTNDIAKAKSNTLVYVSKNYLSTSDAENKYLSLNEHNTYKDYVDDTYLKISDFDSLGITSGSISKFVTSDTLNNYALKSSIDEITETVNTINSTVNKVKQKTTSLSVNLSNNYMKTADMIKSFYTKSDASDLFLLKTDANNNYLTVKSASNKYLSKEEAQYTYVSIEDYRGIKSAMTINDTYKNDLTTFNKLIETGKLIDGLYIVGDCVYIVKDGEAYDGISASSQIDAYTKSEIDGFNFATEDWVNENFGNLKWVITNEY